ncbi:MAG: UDP-N-acetylmuramoyl-L-alanine--D-glutamate ligase [Chloroflexi bacterium]|nr:UDP-N-acetylmuramoyl-L-alanine--D-glutamate ligase [Chloroflexota bacterium]
MYTLADKKALVIGLGRRGRAACRLLRRCDAGVMGMDQASTAELRLEAEELKSLGVNVQLGVRTAPPQAFDFAVLSTGDPGVSVLVQTLAARGIPVISELELGFRRTCCLCIGIAGTNGKTTTVELIERILTATNRKTIAAGHSSLPICAVAERTKDLDFLTLEVSSFQLETITYFRPAVAVLLNITPDHLDRYPTLAACVRATSRLFMNQQLFDWAIAQSEALAQIRSQNLPVPSKVITFSANNRRADIYLDRGLLISRLPDWTGPLLDMDHCQLRGPHNAENLMAALAVGRVLRLPLDQIIDALKTCAPAPHCCELVAEISGVKFINDAKAANADALQKAIWSVPPGRGGEPNVWLIAGGQDKGLEYQDLGPLLAQRVKQAFLIGETRERMRAAWSLFTPCTPADSLLEAVSKAAENAVSGDVILLSPAGSSFDMFQNYQHRGELFRQAVEQWARTTNCSAAVPSSISSSRLMPII